MHKFEDTEHKEKYEARFWNCQGVHICIVAIVTKGIDWAAYIGAERHWTEKDTVEYAAEFGSKMIEQDARHFFPNIDLPYRR